MLATPLSRAGTNNRRNVPAKTYETTYTHSYTSFKHRVDLHYVTRELGVRSLALPLSCCSRHTRPHSEQLNVRFAKMGYRCPTCRVTRRTKPNVRGGSCEPCRWLQRQGKPLPHPMISAVAVPTARDAARTPLPLRSKTKSTTPAVSVECNVSSNCSVAEDAAAAEAAAAELASRTQPHSLLLRNNKKRQRSLSGTRRL